MYVYWAHSVSHESWKVNQMGQWDTINTSTPLWTRLTGKPYGFEDPTARARRMARASGALTYDKKSGRVVDDLPSSRRAPKPTPAERRQEKKAIDAARAAERVQAREKRERARAEADAKRKAADEARKHKAAERRAKAQARTKTPARGGKR